MKTPKPIVIIVALALCLSLAGNVLAFTDTVKMLEAHFSGISILVDGEQITPHDVNGNYVEPFIVDGTTYLPVRAVGEALGKPVSWDGENRAVMIGLAPGSEAAWTELHPYTMDGRTAIYDGSDPTAKFTAAGEERYNGILFNAKGEYLKNANVIWNTNGLKKTMQFTICNAGEERCDVTLTISLGDETYETYTVKWDDVPKTITVPVNYASNVKIALSSESSHPWQYAMYDISFE